MGILQRKKKEPVAAVKTASRNSIIKKRNLKNQVKDVKNPSNRKPNFLKKSLGQHLLHDKHIIQKIVKSADIKPQDIVLEIGPGTGNLTKELVKVARKVVVYEIDPKMVYELRNKIRDNNCTIHQVDILKVDKLCHFDVCVANLPYQISSPFIFKLLGLSHPYRHAVLMFQKEFADRLLATAGTKAYSRLSVNMQMLCNVHRICNVNRKSFQPPPKVDSTVLKISRKTLPASLDFSEYDGLLRICFIRKRKIMRAIFNNTKLQVMLLKNYNVLGGTSENLKETIDTILEELDLTNKRPVDIDEIKFLSLLLRFNKIGLHFKSRQLNDDSEEKELSNGDTSDYSSKS